VNITIQQDGIVEQDEIFTLSLESNDSVLFDQQTAAVVIVDSDDGNG
jgi:hypothetical protein